MIGNIGTGELLLIFLVTLLVFGAKRIPEIARGLGQGIREFKHATRELTREMDAAEPPVPRVRPTGDAPLQRDGERAGTVAPSSTATPLVPDSPVPDSPVPDSPVPDGEQLH